MSVRPSNRDAAGRRAARILAAALAVALSAHLAVALPGTPVPQTAQTLAVLVAGAALGARDGALAMAAYAVAGALGLPVFAEGTAGPERLLGPTAGYLGGFVLAAAAVGGAAERGWLRRWPGALATMLGAHALILLLGWLRLAFAAGAAAAFTAGVAPFLAGGFVKALLAAGAGVALARRDAPAGAVPRAAGLLGALLLSGCGDTAAPDQATVTDSAGIEIVTAAGPDATWTVEPRPELDLGSADGGGPTGFFRIRDIAFVGGDRIAVVDGGSEELRFFSLAGAFLGAAGRPGNGPEEFRGLRSVAVLGDSLLTYDSGNDRVSVRDLTGAFGRSFRLEWIRSLLSPVDLSSPAGPLAVTVRSMTELEGSGVLLDSVLVSRHDLSGALLDTLVRLPYVQRFVYRAGGIQTTVGAAFSSSPGLVAVGDGFCHAFGPAAEIRCYGPDGGLRRLVRAATPPRRVTPRDVDRYWDEAMAAASERYAASLRRVRGAMAFPDLFPAFERLEADARGRIWALRYATPRDTAPEWWVFDRDGRWVASVVMPEGFDGLAFGEDRVAGVWRDELEVERVRVHRLRRGAAQPR